MQLTITFCRQTVKTLSQHLQTAFRVGDLPAIKRITALLLVADQHPPAAIAARLGVGRSTVYAWLQAFLVDRCASLQRRKAPGRPAKLTPTQKQRLGDLVTAGPEAAGYATGCWTSALLQDLIYREFGRMYNVHYVSELLRNLGFSYQKARFVADHLDEVRRQHWRTVRWPAILAGCPTAGRLAAVWG